VYNISVRKIYGKKHDVGCSKRDVIFLKERYNNITGARGSIFVQITQARRVFERVDLKLAANCNVH